MKKRRISSCLNLHSAPKEDVLEYIRQGLIVHKREGFDSADLGLSIFDLSSDTVEENVLRTLEISREIGVRIELCHLPFIGGGGKKDDDFMAEFDRRMHRAIDAAAILGVESAVMHPNAATVALIDFDKKAQYDSVMKHLAPYAEHAAKVGVPLAVENMRVIPTFRSSHRYCQTPEELCELADALGVGVCWDFGHANISGVKPAEGLAYVGKRLREVHINDNCGVDDEHLAPFMGTVNWREAMKALSDIGFEGALNLELSVARVPAEMKPFFAAYAAEAARTLASYMEEI